MDDHDPELTCDVKGCGDEAAYELLDRVCGSDLYQVTARYCEKHALELAEEEE